MDMLSALAEINGALERRVVGFLTEGFLPVFDRALVAALPGHDFCEEIEFLRGVWRCEDSFCREKISAACEFGCARQTEG